MSRGRKLKRVVVISWVDVQREANVLEMMLISVRPGKSRLGVGRLVAGISVGGWREAESSMPRLSPFILPPRPVHFKATNDSTSVGSLQYHVPCALVYNLNWSEEANISCRLMMPDIVTFRFGSWSAQRCKASSKATMLVRPLFYL